MDRILSKHFLVLQSSIRIRNLLKKKDEANINCGDTFDPDNRTVSLDDLSKGQQHELEKELKVQNIELMK